MNGKTEHVFYYMVMPLLMLDHSILRTVVLALVPPYHVSKQALKGMAGQ